MTSRDRVALAMNLDVPDRVPVFCQLAIGHYFLNARPPEGDITIRPADSDQNILPNQLPPELPQLDGDPPRIGF